MCLRPYLGSVLVLSESFAFEKIKGEYPLSPHGIVGGWRRQDMMWCAEHPFVGITATPKKAQQHPHVCVYMITPCSLEF